MQPLRLWPGVLAASLVTLVRWVVPAIAPEAFLYGLIAATAGAVLIVGWWLFFSRASWPDRIGAIVLIAVTTLLLRFVVYPSLAPPMMRWMAPTIALPSTVLPIFVLGVVLGRRFNGARRWAAMAIAIFAGAGIWTLLRIDGVTGYAGMQLRWRWTPTVEDRLLAQANDEPKPLPPQTTLPAKEVVAPLKERALVRPAAEPVVAVKRGNWPGFRGPERNGVIPNLRVNTDWQKSPPTQLWRRAIGPSWSSFAVQGDVIYTQEQRGE